MIMLQEQKENSSGHSILQVYKQAALLRRDAAFRSTDFHFHVVNDDILSFVRHVPGSHGYLVILNFGSHTSTDNYIKGLVKQEFGTTGTVVLNSGNLGGARYEIGEEVALRKITLQQAQGIVLKLEKQK